MTRTADGARRRARCNASGRAATHAVQSQTARTSCVTPRATCQSRSHCRSRHPRPTRTSPSSSMSYAAYDRFAPDHSVRVLPSPRSRSPKDHRVHRAHGHPRCVHTAANGPHPSEEHWIRRRSATPAATGIVRRHAIVPLRSQHDAVTYVHIVNERRPEILHPLSTRTRASVISTITSFCNSLSRGSIARNTYNRPSTRDICAVARH